MEVQVVTSLVIGGLDGDYLSPFIFVLVMGFLSKHMDLSLAAGAIKPIKKGGEQVVSHLLFVDGMLFFSKGNVASLKTIDKVLELLAANTGLVINKLKKQSILQERMPKQTSLKGSYWG